MSGRPSAWLRAPRTARTAGTCGCDAQPRTAGILPTFVDDDSVSALKAEIAPQVEAFDRAVQACAGIVPAMKDAWGAWRDAWRHYAETESGFWTAKEEYDAGLARIGEFNAWRAELLPMCGLPVPPGVEAPVVPGLGGPGDHDPFGLDGSTKWLIGGAIALGLIVALK